MATEDFVWGFDVAYYSLQFGGTGGEPSPIGGRFGGYAAEFGNVGSASQTFDAPLNSASTIWSVHFAFRIYQLPGETWPAGVDLFKVLASSGTLLTIKSRSDHKLDIISGTGPTATSFTAFFSDGHWHSIEVAFNKVTGEIELWIDDVLDATCSGFPPGGAAPDNPSSCKWKWDGGGNQGFDLDDISISSVADASGHIADVRTGPVQVVASKARADGAKQWTTLFGTSHIAMIGESLPSISPDFEGSYVSASFVSTALVETFAFNPFSCRGRILAVIAQAIARSPSFTGNLGLFCSSPALSLAQWLPAIGSSYGLAQGITTTPSSATATLGLTPVWNDGQVNAAYWGFKLTSGDARVTTFWVEKLVTLRNVPYACGGGRSYSW